MPTSQSDQFSIDDHLSYVRAIVNQGGPRPQDYAFHLSWYTALNKQIQAGLITEEQRNCIRTAFADKYSANTVQGHAFERPLGYVGDYQLLDKIYRGHISADEEFANYDRFFQAQVAPEAVRNRKRYFKELIRSECIRRQGRTLSILNLASGSCLDLEELLNDDPLLPIEVFCLDLDSRAVEYAQKRLARHAHKVHIEVGNILLHRPRQKYSLIWSAGLFDYFSDKVFRRVLRRYTRALTPEGHLVVGNFGDDNPSKGYMEALALWCLYHRSDDQLMRLAADAGIGQGHYVAVGHEQTGVNRFLHILNTEHSLRWDLPHVGTPLLRIPSTPREDTLVTGENDV